MKKRIISVLLILSLSFFAISCSKGNKSKDGADGKDGLSAYDIYLKYHPDYQGTEEEWINSMSGSDTSISPFDFYPLDDGTCAVALERADYLSEVTIPKQHNGITITKIVRSIDEDKLNYVTKKIYIPNTIVEIGEYSFEEFSELETVEIEENSRLQIIGRDAFCGCDKLKTINLPSSICKIGNDAFGSCENMQKNEYENGYYLGVGDNPYYILLKAIDKNISSFSIHGDCVNIYSNAFYNYNSLTSITIPNSVKQIGSNSFYGCGNLSKVNINSIESWCNITFVGYASNPAQSSRGLYLNNVRITELVIPSSITSINDYAFYNFSRLTSITIPNSVTSIGESAFSNCTNIDSITIPGSVINIENMAFISCSKLASVTIENGVQSIGSQAFAYCNGLSSVIIPNSLINIESYAFERCDNLSSIIIPDSVDKMGGYVFFGCSNLQIKCRAASIPFGWNSDWNPGNRPVVWGYTVE